jgi:hypothetical protein
VGRLYPAAHCTIHTHKSSHPDVIQTLNQLSCLAIGLELSAEPANIKILYIGGMAIREASPIPRTKSYETRVRGAAIEVLLSVVPLWSIPIK